MRELLLVVDLPLLWPAHGLLAVRNALVDVGAALVLGRVDQVLLLRRWVMLGERRDAVGRVPVRACVLCRAEGVGGRVVVELGRELMDCRYGSWEVAAERREVHGGVRYT